MGMTELGDWNLMKPAPFQLKRKPQPSCTFRREAVLTDGES